MSKGFSSYRIKDPNALYFITFSTVQFIDIFTRKKYSNVIVESLKHCQENKGLIIVAWCLMSNHIHLMARAEEGDNLADILRDFKKFTAKKLIKLLIEKGGPRKNWMLNIMMESGKKSCKKQAFQVWRNDNHPIETNYNYIIDQKVNYIHFNPVKAGIVLSPEHYLNSSARNYYGLEGLLDVEIS